MMDCEIRLYKTGGRLSIIMSIVAIDLADARSQAIEMLKADILEAEIWTDLTLVDTVGLEGSTLH